MKSVITMSFNWVCTCSVLCNIRSTTYNFIVVCIVIIIVPPCIPPLFIVIQYHEVIKQRPVVNTGITNLLACRKISKTVHNHKVKLGLNSENQNLPVFFEATCLLAADYFWCDYAYQWCNLPRFIKVSCKVFLSCICNKMAAEI